MEDRHEPRTDDAWRPNALDSVQDAFDWLVRGPDPLTIQGRLFPRLPDRRLQLDRVRRMLTSPTCTQATRDAVWAHLVLRTRTDVPAWKVGAAGMALPVLTSVAAGLHEHVGCDRDDIAGDVLRGFLDGLEVVDIARPQIMTRLRWSAYRAAHSAQVAAAHAPIPCGGTEEVHAVARMTSASGSAPSPLPFGHPDLVLVQAVADRVLTRMEANLIGATRLDHVTVEDWAAAHASTVWATYRERRRAEQRLIAYLLDPCYRRGRPHRPHTRCVARRRPHPRSTGGCRTCRSRRLTAPMSRTGPRSDVQKHRAPTSSGHPTNRARPASSTKRHDEKGGPTCA